MGSPWRWRSGCWMTRAGWNIWLVSNYRKCVNMSNVKCVKSEALTIMIKGWSYLSKGAILVASSTCGKNTNIKRNAKAKESDTLQRLIMQRFNTSKVVAAILRDWPKPSSSSTLCVCVIFFIDLDHQNTFNANIPRLEAIKVVEASPTRRSLWLQSRLGISSPSSITWVTIIIIKILYF